MVQEARSSLQLSRDAYTKAVSQRSASQREVNELLQRKHGWNPTDLERFTELYRSDHTNEQAESAAQRDFAEAERCSEEAAAQLSKNILARYHEEQIWSDKIRRMSTWGTWGLMGVNVLLFLVFQIGVEPWRRKRLVKGFEDKVMEALEREAPLEDGISMGRQRTKDVGPENATLRNTVTDSSPNDLVKTSIIQPLSEIDISEDSRKTSTADIPPPYATDWVSSVSHKNDLVREGIRDLFSDGQISIKRIDLTIIALEGAAAGMAFAGLFLLLLRPR